MNGDSIRAQSSQLQRIATARCDRRQIAQRLQDLDLACTCLDDGSLQVDISHPIAALQLWSVMQQFTASRSALVDRLTQCWRQSA
jgi:hypothetical protein